MVFSLNYRLENLDALLGDLDASALAKLNKTVDPGFNFMAVNNPLAKSE
jgi:hypothetical protein